MAQAITLVLITRDSVSRIDLKAGRSASVVGVWSAPRPNLDDLATLVDSTLRQGPRRRAGVWVLSTDFWTGPVELARELVTQLQGDNLRQTLGFEAETYSGLAGFDSEIEYRQIATSPAPTYWVTQLPLGTRESADRIVRAWGGKLLGLAHPASAHPPTRDSQQPWARVECWDDVVLAASPSPSEPNRVQLLSGDGRSEATRRQLEPWITGLNSQNHGAHQQRFQWWNSRSTDHKNVPTGWTPLARDEAVDLKQWACDWWNTRSFAIRPTFAPLKRSLSQTTTLTIGLVFALLAAVGCYGHYWFTQKQLAVIDEQLADLASRKEQFALQQKSVNEQQKTLSERQSLIAVLTDDIRWAEQVGELQAQMHKQLLDGIAESCREQIIILGIDSEPDSVLITGYSIGDRACHDFAERLRIRIAPYGWQVDPAVPNRRDEINPSLYFFEITLHEQPTDWFARPRASREPESQTTPDPSATVDTVTLSSPTRI